MDNLIDQLLKLEQIHMLIKLQATGCSQALAGRLGVSRRTAERTLRQLRDLGFPIGYDCDRRTYFYEEEVAFSFQLLINGKSEISIKGA